jgi:protease-4
MSTFLESVKSLWRRLSRRSSPGPEDRLLNRMEELVRSGELSTPAGSSALNAMLLVDITRQRTQDRRLKEDEARWKRYRRITLTIMALSGVIAWSALYLYRNGFKMPIGKPVSVVTIKGDIGVEQSGSAENIIPALRRAFANEDSPGVILRINSPGGLPVDSERVNVELEHLRKKHPGKEVTAVIETVGASAAYMIAVHADRICAAKYSLVGSVGIILKAWNVHGLAERLDVSNESFGSGKYKSLLDPFKPMSEDDRSKVFALVNEMGETFASEVVKQRGAKLKMTREELASGEAWPGTAAVKLGLVDEFCTLESVAARYGGKPRDYGPYASNGFGVEETARAIGRGILEGMSSVAGKSLAGETR